MTASAPQPSQVTAEQRAHEPSMEEILASIRRIIADDQVLPLTRPAAAPKPEGNVAPMLRPFGRSDEASVRPEPPAEAPAPVLRPVPVQRADDRASAEHEPGGEVPFNAGERRRPPFGGARLRNEDGLGDLRQGLIEEISPRKDEEPAPQPIEDSRRSDAIGADQQPEADFEGEASNEEAALLSVDANASVASAFQSLASTVMIQKSGMIEQSIREMLRPMLKQWLDDNLPPLVERLVRAEIERVARGGN